jgi:hypothetical protein
MLGRRQRGGAIPSMTWRDSLEAAAAITRAVNSQDAAAAVFASLAKTARNLSDSAIAPLFAGYLAFYRGHLDDGLRAMDVVKQARGPAGVAMLGWLASVGALDSASAADVFGGWIKNRDVKALASAMPVWLAWNDTTSIRAAIGAANAVAAQPNSADSLAARYASQIGTALVALARKDTAAAISGLTRADSPRIPWTSMPLRLLTARLMAARSDLPGAAKLLDSRPPADALNVLEVVWKLERARIADRMGDATRANSYYSFVATAWAGADPRLANLVAEAKRHAR